jgi:hypothetical protein
MTNWKLISTIKYRWMQDLIFGFNEVLETKKKKKEKKKKKKNMKSKYVPNGGDNGPSRASTLGSVIRGLLVRLQIRVIATYSSGRLGRSRKLGRRQLGFPVVAPVAHFHFQIVLIGGVRRCIEVI